MQPTPFFFPSLSTTLSKFSDLRTFESQTSDLTSLDIIPLDDPDRLLLDDLLSFNSPFSSIHESKAISCFIASAIGDALGAHLEGQLIDYTRQIITDFDSLDKVIQHNMARPSNGLYTDDTAQALCLSDSILINKYEFNGVDIRHRILLWWYEGYNNGRMNDEKSKLSFGLGIATMNGFYNFIKKPSPYMTSTLDYNSEMNANGSIMRLAPVPIAFHHDAKKGSIFAENQSRATHNGTEAAELCRILTLIMIKFINTESIKDCKAYLENLHEYVMSDNPAVQALIRSENEKDFELYEMSKYNSTLEDRNWNWKDKGYKYSPFRSSQSPNFIGVYSMDCATMALHCVYHTNSTKEALIKAINLGGDADSVACVTGMLAGSLYGYDEYLKEQYKHVKKWDNGKIALRAYKLFHKKIVYEYIPMCMPICQSISMYSL